MFLRPWIVASAIVAVAPAAASPSASGVARICGVVLARQSCGATTGTGCQETVTRLPHWRLRVARPGLPQHDQVITTSGDGSFDAVVAPGDYLVSSAESTLAGLAEPRPVTVAAGDCVRVELTVQLLRP